MKKKLSVFFAFLVLCTMTKAQSPMAIAKENIEASKGQYGLRDADLKDWLVTDQYLSKKSGLTNIYLRQTFQGIEIPEANINIHITAAGEVLHLRNTFVPNLAKAVKSSNFSIPAASAVSIAAQAQGLTIKELKQVEQRENEVIFSEGGIAIDPIPAKKILHRTDGKEIRAAWQVRIYTLDAQHNWIVRVDAENGAILQVNDGVIHCNFGDGHLHCDREEMALAHKLETPRASAYSNFKAEKQSNAGDTYNVFPLGIESPNHGGRMLLTDPADATASPYGWHDTNGVAGAEYTITRGNNVHAQDDLDGNNGNGTSPDGGAALLFDFPFQSSWEPDQFLDASTTNLFYWSNIMHDVYYQYGFDEASGNFQANNYGNGGTGGDYVLADCQDGFSTNNANFNTPADGGSGRMQMFLWNGGGDYSDFLVNQPSSIARIYTYGAAAFGPTTYDITGEVVEAVDASANPNEACNAVTNGTTVNGKVAMIDRGSCNFSAKVFNAQEAGAIAVIICNNQANTAVITMGTGVNGNLVNIPSVMLSLEDCATLRMETGVEVTFSAYSLPNQLDGSFDNGIIAHEYGHGISTRLTGGPSNSGCLGGSEQMGEGWSDFFGLVLTVKEGDVANTARGIGTFAQGQIPSGGGIRPFRYSHDMGVNPHTYDDIKSAAVPHGVGSVWCAMIWDLYWDMVNVYGFDDDLYNGTGGNNMAMQLVIEGCKLQGCSPGFVDGRDAIIAADKALYGGVNECTIWTTFARRGLGASAIQGSSNSRADGTEAFDMPNDALITKSADATEIYEGGTVTFTLDIEGRCEEGTNLIIEDPLPSDLTYVPGSASNNGTATGNTVTYPTEPTLAALSSQSYSLQATVNAGAYYAADVLLDDDLQAGGGNWVSTGADNNNKWVTTNSASCGSTAFYAQNFGITSDQVLTLASSRTLNRLGTLQFDHYYDTEGTWDGGVVEISIDNGATWIDLGDHFTMNGYNSAISGNAGTSIAGRASFTGDSGGCITSTVNLCSFFAETVLIRFVFAEDTNTNEDGWYIDNIVLTDEAAIKNEASATASGITNYSSICLKIVPPPAGITVDAKLMLEGPYVAADLTMNDALRSFGTLPTAEPYTAQGYTFVNGAGGEMTESTVFNTTGDDAIVDWVFVELRDANDPTVVLATRAGLLQRDGNITDVDGISPLFFEGVADDDYYVAVFHRNHLAIMTEQAVALSASSGMLDFSSPATAVYGTNGRKDVAGVMVLWAGEIDGSDHIVDASDRSAAWNGRNQSGYLRVDADMSGTCDASDRSIEWNNRNKSAQLP